MNSIKFLFLHNKIADWRRLMSKCLLLLACLFILGVQPAYAGIDNDLYDGNIFVVYAGNGSLVPPRQTLAQALAEHKPTVLAFYVDDSSDCKKYAISISRIQEFYGRAAEIIPLNVDTIPSKKTYNPTEPGYYYSGSVPQIVVFNKSGQVVLNKKGQVPYEEIDDSLRQVFDLLPRAKTAQLKRRAFNEFSSELAK
ncbi:thylakoid membrane photosystem I accumulation factor [Nostoc sp. MG11]|uniref:thylakoid membrane photosystem I accumulation factor n=1 Tax=Nostoc sp. MG11 TaxID=2721166 RepID=UPI001868002C|nr:thylakoid membrane photosystem I accumulation factor [Nostoc sp. MG11]